MIMQESGSEKNMTLSYGVRLVSEDCGTGTEIVSRMLGA